MSSSILTTRQKALKVNLDPKIYGTLAEIGAGQEVARHFFQAGGASGTIAKSMSAYDKVFSDEVYGKEKGGRYVSEPRLTKMLKKEYEVLELRLKDIRSEDTLFFSFANTVAAINYFGTNESHGWIGLRYQTTPGGTYNDVVVHVRMLDHDNVSQQHALGVMGVNLIYSAFYNYENSDSFIDSLMDNLTPHRIEINMIRFSGKAFEKVDNRIANLRLLRNGFTDAVMFDEKGEVVLASEHLYRKNVLVVRGSYRPPTLVNVDILEKGQTSYMNETELKEEDVTTVCEITMSNLSQSGDISRTDFLARVDILSSLGQKVLISNYHQYFRLTEYFSKFKNPNLGIVLGVYNFQQIFDHDYNNFDDSAVASLGLNVKNEDEEKEQLNVLASVGLLFRPNVKVFVYPFHSKVKGESIHLDELNVSNENKHLVDYLRMSGQLFDIKNSDDTISDIYSRKVLEMIRNDEKGWEEMVPKKVAKTINKNKFFSKKD